MPTPTHHISEIDLLGYVTGSLPGPVELWVACHLTYCPACRQEVAMMEAVGGALLQAQGDGPAPSVPTLLDPPDSDGEAVPPAPSDAVFPSPLRQRVGPLRDVPFRSAGYGVRIATVARDEGLRTFLVDFPPGFRVPRHGHRGVERGLVLRGGYREGTQHFVVGDVDVKDGPEDQHASVIDHDGPCTALFVAEGPVTVSSAWLTWLADWWLHR